MIKVYLVKIDSEWDHAELKQHLSALPQEIKDRILRYKGWKERQSRIAGKLLLLRLIKDFGLDHSLHDLQYTSFHKPFFAGDFDFSIAHSGDMVMCAGSLRSKIGADIEMINLIELTDYREQLHPNEWQMIQTATDQPRMFYEIWTKKEALLKATGQGVDMELAGIDVCSDTLGYESIIYHFHTFTGIESYMAAIATSAPSDSGSVSFERLSDLL